MKPLKLVVLASLLLFSFARAANWASVGTSTDGAQYDYDRDKVSRTPAGLVRVWLRTSNEAVRKPVKFHSSVVLWEIDCLNNSYRPLSVTQYDRDGSVVYSNAGDFERHRPITPDSMMEAVHQAICSSR